jgi:hypothetical protein
MAAIMAHPALQQMEECISSWHGVAANAGAAPKTMRSRTATALEKNLMPVK